MFLFCYLFIYIFKYYIYIYIYTHIICFIFWILRVNDSMDYLSAPKWILSLSIYLPGSSMFCKRQNFILFFMAEQCAIACVCVCVCVCVHVWGCVSHILFVNSSVDGHLSCFLILAIINNTALKLGCMQMCLGFLIQSFTQCFLIWII